MSTTDPSATKKNPLMFRLGLAVIVLLVIWAATQLWGSGLLVIGTTAPAFELPRVLDSAETVDLEALRGQVVVLDFWGIHCPPCFRQADVLDSVHRQLSSRGVTIVGVVVNFEDLSEVTEFINKKNIQYPMVYDRGPVAAQYRVMTLPTLYVIDRHGRIAAAHRGFWDRQSLSAAINSVL